MTKITLEYCPFCGEKSYAHCIKPMTLTYKSQQISVNQPGYWCNHCGEGIIGGTDRKQTQKELQELRAKIDGLLSPQEIKKVREKLHLTQRKAAEIFGGGVNAFSKYERGELPVSKPLSQLFHLLDKHPNLLTELNDDNDQRRVSTF